MLLTQDYKNTLTERVANDPAFAKALLDEAISLFLNDEPEVARLVLRDLVNATIGFEALAQEVKKPSKSLHRMLSAKGNPTMDNLTKIVSILKNRFIYTQPHISTDKQKSLAHLDSLKIKWNGKPIPNRDELYDNSRA